MDGSGSAGGLPVVTVLSDGLAERARARARLAGVDLGQLLAEALDAYLPPAPAAPRPPLAPLTDRQGAVLAFLRRSVRERGFPPSLREIGAEFGIKSTNGVSDHLRALARKGYVQISEMKSRGIRVLADESAS